MLEVLDQPGPLEVETVVSCDRAVSRAGLLNLDHEKAKAAGLVDRDEPIQVYFHVVRHLPRGTPIYAGPGESAETEFRNLVLQRTMNRLFEGQAPTSELQFQPDPDGRFDGVIDVFGDGSFWALFVPGHTVGSIAYLARTASGPVLMVGDTSHTKWGWENGVEPGKFTGDRPRNAVQLARLKALAAEHPAMSVRLGHQELAPTRE